MDLTLDATCPDCDGREIVIPSVLDEAVTRLRKIMDSGPGADMSLDQSHSTAETKVRRVLALFRAGVLPGGSLLLVGDDDLISVALLVVGEILGAPLVTRLGVVDVSSKILGYIREVTSQFDVRVETVRQDLRDPLADKLLGQFDAAMTDPPYTTEGARLFLSRAIEGLRPGAGRSIFFSFGSKGPTEMFEVQQEIMRLGLVTYSLIRNFNEYKGSGILGGTGFMQQLLTTHETKSSLKTSRYDGPLYTRDKRSRKRTYECVACGAIWAVGPGARWPSVGALRDNGCPECGGGPFKPGRLVAETSEEPASPAVTVPSNLVSWPHAEGVPPVRLTASSAPETLVASREGTEFAAYSEITDDILRDLSIKAAPYVVRPAGEADLDAIADFEVTIARNAFREDAVDNPERHRVRIARAMAKSRSGMYVACRPTEDGEQVVGWLWIALNQNSLTGAWFANFRSLATSPIEQQSEVAELLVATGLRYVANHDVQEVVGRTFIGNLAMRVLYRRFGFSPTHLKMERKLPVAGAQ
jgi:predicted methyltransferase/RimJ/RimL family protein N-acetyltransferase